MNTASNRNEIINRSIGRIALIAVPLFFAVSELIHPVSQDTIMGEIESAKNNSGSWLISHGLQLLAIVFLPFIIQKLISFFDDKNSWLSISGIVLSYIGVIGVTGLLAYDFLLWDAWKVGSNEAVAAYLEILNSSAFGLIFKALGPVLFLIGFLTLIILMIMSNKIKRWKSILILIGLLIYGLAGPLVPVPNGHLLVSFGALIMLVGFVGVLKEDLSRA